MPVPALRLSKWLRPLKPEAPGALEETAVFAGFGASVGGGGRLPLWLGTLMSCSSSCGVWSCFDWSTETIPPPREPSPTNLSVPTEVDECGAAAAGLVTKKVTAPTVMLRISTPAITAKSRVRLLRMH